MVKKTEIDLSKISKKASKEIVKIFFTLLLLDLFYHSFTLL